MIIGHRLLVVSNHKRKSIFKSNICDRPAKINHVSANYTQLDIHEYLQV